MEERRKKLRMKLNVKEYYVSSPLSSPPSTPPPPALRIMIFFACQDILDEIAPPPSQFKNDALCLYWIIKHWTNTSNLTQNVV